MHPRNMFRAAIAPAALALTLAAAYTGGREPASRGDEPIVLVALVAAVAALPLVLGRARPWPVLVVLLAEIVTAAASGLRSEQLWPLLLAAGLVLTYLTATRGRRDGLAAMAVALLAEETAWLVGLVRGEGWERVLVPGFVGLAVLLALSIVAAWLAGKSVQQRREYGEALRVHEAAQAVAEERLRIARELHDMVAHSIGVIAIQAGAGHRVLRASPDQAEGALRTIEDTSRQTLRDLRVMLDVLRRVDAEADVLPRTDALAGLDGLERLTANARAAGVRVEVDLRVSGARGPLPPTVDHAAFRIVQESVTNVVRHANTTACRVEIDHRPDVLTIDITDNGRADDIGQGSGLGHEGGLGHGSGQGQGQGHGHDGGHKHGSGGGGGIGRAEGFGHGDGTGGTGRGEGHGISGMRERVALLGGRFSAAPRPEGGFRVRASLPLPGSVSPAPLDGPRTLLHEEAR
ncbi:sensor histidine kinase [Actinomadura oligospora]|uniref:sensor histidine kinase n=1 Tax=Actinomadura oligospora TaxID=111804 RepID=UPI001472D638|nr:histidine kinase [Actinomadura oligospora]